MEQLAISKATPKDQNPSDKPSQREQLFVGTFISLSWQLLIVVLVPFIGGHFIDQKYGTAPLFTLLGLGLALATAGLLTYRAYRTIEDDYKDRFDK